jgi:catechol 2,3-dioxygenase-like lactoylglutathione lyase family enzyme
MTQIGNHIKMTLPVRLRGRAREFYRDVLGCHTLESPLPELDLYEFDGGFVVGLFFAPDSEVIPEADYLRATWLELKVAEPAALKSRLQAFGVTEVSYPDPTRFFFQAPGGQVFRLAPLDGGM